MCTAVEVTGVAKFDIASICFFNNKIIIRKATSCEIYHDILLKDALIIIKINNSIEITGIERFVHRMYEAGKVTDRFLNTLETSENDFVTYTTQSFFGSKFINVIKLFEGTYLKKETKPFKLITSVPYEIYY
jgi:hypothetical protein